MSNQEIGEFKKRLQETTKWFTVMVPTTDATTGLPSMDAPMRLPVIIDKAAFNILDEAKKDFPKYDDYMYEVSAPELGDEHTFILKTDWAKYKLAHDNWKKKWLGE